METSASIGAIAAALVKVQGEIENPTKNAVNPHFRSKYADLAEIVNVARPVLTKHGIAVVQSPGFANGSATLDTMLVHASGEWIRGTAGAPIQKDDPQGVGSAVTYLRRYSLAAFFGLAQEDDDGNAASTGSVSSAAPPKGGHASPTGDATACPQCGSGIYDNRTGKRNPKAPDWKCRSKDCDWALWITSTREKLSVALDALVADGAITAKQHQNVMDGTAGGDIEAFRIAEDFVNSHKSA